MNEDNTFEILRRRPFLDLLKEFRDTFNAMFTTDNEPNIEWFIERNYTLTEVVINLKRLEDSDDPEIKRLVKITKMYLYM